MTEQERKEIIDKHGYPPHMPCGECSVYSSYCDAEETQDEAIMNKVVCYCSDNCPYYREMHGSRND